MTRQIKFRAWDVSELRIYSDCILKLEYAIENPDEIILMQFIGRKDCEGNDVYDGDIFKDDCHTYIIYWNDNACGFKIKTIGRGKLVAPKYRNLEGVLANLAVIGNEYETPYLLK